MVSVRVGVKTRARARVCVRVTVVPSRVAMNDVATHAEVGTRYL